MQDFLTEFGDLDGYVDSLPTPPTTSVSKTKPILPEIPVDDIQDLTQLINEDVALREDKPVTYTPRAKRGATTPDSTPKKDDKVESTNATPSTQTKSPVPSHQKTNPQPSKEHTGSINKISTPAITEPISLVKVNPLDQDQDLVEMAASYDVFSLSDVADYQVVSPTAAEFVAQYYRLINTMIAKVSLNQLVSEPIEVNNYWHHGIMSKTLNISGSNVYAYDDIYRYCVQDSVVDLLRAKYQSKQVHLTQMETHQIMGAGDGISSAQQATYYLEKMATASFSSTLSMLIFRRKAVKIRDWFENVLKVKNSTRVSIKRLIQNAVVKSSEEQAMEYKNNNDVFVTQSHRCILFAKKLLNRHANIQLPDTHLQISALIFMLSGISESRPNIHNIGFEDLYEGLTENPSLVDSLIHLSYESHRHCYPINELSHL